MKIGLISDSHGHVHEDIEKYLSCCDEIWHAGDIGSIDTLKKLERFKKLRAVHGNIDDELIRREIPESLIFSINKLKFLITHIAGSIPNYNPKTLNLIKENNPNILICGHSHILKVVRDSKNNLLFINPGACGRVGFHKKKTIMRFDILENKIDGLEVIELS
jgi:putative phosphoesterase